MSRPVWLVVLAALTLVTGCATQAAAPTGGTQAGRPSSAPSSIASGGSGSASASTSTTARPSGSASTAVTNSCQAMAASLLRAEQIGQLLMVGVQNRLDEGTAAVITRYRVGSVVLLGTGLGSRSDVTVLTSRVGQLEDGIPILVSADQEGGLIQRLNGPGFTTIPSAVVQSRTTPATLSADWKRWGGELKRAGVLYNLAPVGDVVPTDKQTSNAPIGSLRRQYGATAGMASPLVTAAITGMHQAGVATSVKHFPGLGQVKSNTDFGVATDTVIGPDDPGLAVFASAIKAGTDSVMISSAIYTKIDPDHQAVFSSTVITDLLRTKLGYDKVVISDDLGAAQSVAQIPAGERAVRFIKAGGDLVINADPDTIGAMVKALSAKADADPAFAAKITASAARVLTLKQGLGQLRCG